MVWLGQSTPNGFVKQIVIAITETNPCLTSAKAPLDLCSTGKVNTLMGIVNQILLAGLFQKLNLPRSFRFAAPQALIQ